MKVSREVEVIKARRLNPEGISVFVKWLRQPEGKVPPVGLLDDDLYSDIVEGLEIDPSKEFASRMEFGRYLNEQFAVADFLDLMAPHNDGLWAWLAVVWFPQLTEKRINREEHYVVVRKSPSGKRLSYRHAVRTPFELVHVHGENALICLKSPMHTFGDMTEQLASRQKIAYNKGFFQAAYRLYANGGSLKRGWSTRAKKPLERKPGDRAGKGGVRRLVVALSRLDLTYDTHDMSGPATVEVLPVEFSRWKTE